ncbi:MAG: tyrosine/phenylalanine carboxypeptidase domain-containing protein [Candidatus Absconditabacteria bacterium]
MLDFGILGINSRNLNYIKRFNKRKAIKLADNKLKTKIFLSERGIPVPETYGVISSRKQLQEYNFSNFPKEEYVIKPNKGSKGNGIFIVKNLGEVEFDEKPLEKNFFNKIKNKINSYLEYKIPLFTKDQDEENKNHYKLSEKIINHNTLTRYLLDILGGKHSLTIGSDTILIEEKLIPGEGFKQFCEFGLADIRVIVFNLVPIAAMVRIPTEESKGKANLAQGGAAAGIEVGSGKIYSYYKKRKLYMNQFPKNLENLKGYQMPYWDEILSYSSQIQFYANLGYLALDWVITNEGPKILEINARAGLEVQNVCGLNMKNRLDKINGLKIIEPEKGVEIAKSLFSDKKLLIGLDKVLYLSQMGKLKLGKDKGTNDIEMIVEVDLNKEKSYIHANHFEKYEKARQEGVASITPKGSSIILKNLKLYGSEKIPFNKIILGKNIASEYYIKPINIITIGNSIIKDEEIDISEFDKLNKIDYEINSLGYKVNISKILKPINYFEEFDNFITWKGKYNPHFIYQFPSETNIQKTKNKIDSLISEINILKSNVSKLFLEKVIEIDHKINLIKAYKDQDFANIYKYNLLIYGDFDKELSSISKKIIFDNFSKQDLGKKVTPQYVKFLFEKHLEKIGIFGINIIVGNSGLSRITVKLENNPIILISNNATFFSKEVPGIIAHEIDTHLIRHLNGKKSGWNIFQKGTGFYLKDEEGLAIYKSREITENHYESLGIYKKYHLANVGANFTFSKIVDFIVFLDQDKSIESSFKGALRIKKGIQDTNQIGEGTVYMKDKLYLDGYHKIKSWVESGGNTDKLILGKYKIEDLDYLNLK